MAGFRVKLKGTCQQTSHVQSSLACLAYISASPLASILHILIMAHLVPHARRYDEGNRTGNFNTSDRPSSSYNPTFAPPQAPHVPQRPISEYVPPPIYHAAPHSTSSTSTPHPYSQPPIEQFSGLSVNSDASRYSDEYRRNAGGSSGGVEQPRYQLRDKPEYTSPLRTSGNAVVSLRLRGMRGTRWFRT